MTYNVGDDATLTVPVIDVNGGTLALTAAIVAHNSDGDEQTVTASWTSAVAPLNDAARPGATFRNIGVPLATLPAGLWGLVLPITGSEDLFLGNVYIE